MDTARILPATLANCDFCQRQARNRGKESGERGSAAVEGGRLMGKESAKRKSGKEEDRTLSFGRRHACGGSGGGVSYDLTSGTEERTLGRRLLWLAGPAQRGRLRRCGPVGLVAVKHRDPQQIHLEKHQAERCGSPEEPTIQAIRHCLPFRAKPRAQPSSKEIMGKWLGSAHL